ncbi:MAG: sigma-70 family RNA polymerase sigma factor [Bacteroidales bacterium]|nr:sigma-70 family RNA polymerase sigma factor [Bacteroidales bacterium]
MLKKQLQKMDRLSDRQLVDLLLANDEAAVEYVFFHRCDGLFARVLSSFPSHQAQKKEELITDFYLFLRADDWRRLRQFSFRSELNTWMTVVAIRFFNQKITSSQTNTAGLDAPLNQGVNQIPDDFDLFDQLSKVELYEAIDRLPKPRERFALLGELAGKKAETIAEELGCSVMAVYNLTKKAKMALKKKMKGETK